MFSKNEYYRLREHENYFVKLFFPAFMQQKIDYIHQNPVRAVLVYRAEDYIFKRI